MFFCLICCKHQVVWVFQFLRCCVPKVGNRSHSRTIRKNAPFWHHHHLPRPSSSMSLQHWNIDQISGLFFCVPISAEFELKHISISNQISPRLLTEPKQFQLSATPFFRNQKRKPTEAKRSGSTWAKWRCKASTASGLPFWAASKRGKGHRTSADFLLFKSTI